MVRARWTLTPGAPSLVTAGPTAGGEPEMARTVLNRQRRPPGRTIFELPATLGGTWVDSYGSQSRWIRYKSCQAFDSHDFLHRIGRFDSWAQPGGGQLVIRWLDTFPICEPRSWWDPMVIDPTNANIIYVPAFDAGLLKSTDGGRD
jgi:hypothetical protein